MVIDFNYNRITLQTQLQNNHNFKNRVLPMFHLTTFVTQWLSLNTKHDYIKNVLQSWG